MKVLFAINNDNNIDTIIKKYQKDYREILSYKSVYYFNAIYNELQKDKTYDRVVISEDLEPFASNNYEIIDNFLIEKLEKIREEAKKINGDKIDIILICTDRRNRTDQIVNKYYKIGINNAIVKEDRTIEDVCKLINRPKNENEARLYYGIVDSKSANQANNENYVSEAEVQNILMHYKRLGKDEDKYVESFNNIVTQYTDAQLMIIINYLPIQVRAVLEEKSKKYQELIISSRNKNKQKFNNYKSQKDETVGVKMLEDASSKNKTNRPIVIPSNINLSNKKKTVEKGEQPVHKKIEIPEFEIPEIEEIAEEIVKKRGRGRPKKIVEPQDVIEDKPKRGRGRPKKIIEESVQQENKEEAEEDLLDLFNLEEESKIPESSNNESDEIDLFSLDDEKTSDDAEEENIDLFNLEDETNKEDIDLFGLDDEDEEENDINLFDMDAEDEEEIDTYNEDNEFNQPRNEEILQSTGNRVTNNINTLLTSDKKVISFVGTTKNGTSFIVNNVATLLSSMGISTAILDMTVSRNAYYIYTNNEENLRNTAKNSIKNLEKGIANGIRINKNLFVYTSLPGSHEEYNDIESIIATLAQNYSAVLIDTDFNTPKEIFGISQEIFLVQSMDVLTIQPLTAFLRNLKSKGILKQDKIKIVINKELKLKNLPVKTLIGGMAYYNDPAMSFMTELFDKDNVLYCTIPFEVQTYSRYLESLVNCQINLNGYSKQFMSALNELGNMVYPLINRRTYKPMGNKKELFSNQVNETLNKMKKNY